MRRFTLPTVLAAAFAAFSVAGGGAQGPTAAECALPPLTLPLFAATPAAMVTPPPFDPVAAGDVDEEEITAALTTIMACISTGDAAYEYAVFTERYLAAQFADPTTTYQPAFEAEIAEGALEPGTPFALVAVSDLAVLDDGRVSVVVDYTNGISDLRDTLILARVGDLWLIDEVAEIDDAR